MYYEDRLGGPGFDAGLVAARTCGTGVVGEVAGASDARSSSASAIASRSSICAARRGSAPIESRRRRELLRALAAPVGVAAARAGGVTMLRTNLSTRPFYNERLVHWLLGVAFAARRRVHGLQRDADPAPLSAPGGAGSGRGPRRDAGADADCPRARRCVAQHRPQERSSASAPQAAEANAIIDAAHVLVDRAVQRHRGDAAADVMLTSITPNVGQGRRRRCSFTVLGRDVDSDRHVHREARGDRRFDGVQVASESRDRRGPVPDAGHRALPRLRRVRHAASGDAASRPSAPLGARPEGGAMIDTARIFARSGADRAAGGGRA